MAGIAFFASKNSENLVNNLLTFRLWINSELSHFVSYPPLSIYSIHFLIHINLITVLFDGHKSLSISIMERLAKKLVTNDGKHKVRGNYYFFIFRSIKMVFSNIFVCLHTQYPSFSCTYIGMNTNSKRQMYERVAQTWPNLAIGTLTIENNNINWVLVMTFSNNLCHDRKCFYVLETC